MRRSKSPTIVDVAAEAGVSKSAVSRALLGQGDVSAETRARIEAAAERLGYVANAMARGLVSSRTKTLGVVLRDVRKPYYAYVQAGTQAQAEVRGYRIVTTTNAGRHEVADAKREMTNLVSLQVDGLIIAPARLPSEEYLPYLERVPIVVAGRQEMNPGMSSVACDDTFGGSALARHLLALGHRRIAVLLVDPTYSQRYSSRGFGMIDGIQKGGGTPVVWKMGTDHDAAVTVATHLDSNDVTAIMCPTDAAALAALEALRQRSGSTIDDYSVTGYDGFGPLAAPYLGLSTFRSPVEEMGRAAVDLLVDRLEERTNEDRFVSLRGKVIEGRTARSLTLRPGSA
ncbi:LacI family DNA-binding transcriptional regulator [Streptomyces chartreusis]|uniref:LacI family DNA-binding transcriptional regulator n=1 Tax=Streptomyces chartreusis TaxID=1969 RepID=UPI003647A56F